MFPELSPSNNPSHPSDNLSDVNFGEKLRQPSSPGGVSYIEAWRERLNKKFSGMAETQERIVALWDRLTSEPAISNGGLSRNSPERLVTFLLRERSVAEVSAALPFLLEQPSKEALQLLRIEPYCWSVAWEMRKRVDPQLYLERLKLAGEVLKIPRQYVADMNFPDPISYRVGVLVLAVAPRAQLGRDLMELNQFINAPNRNTGSIGVMSCYDWYIDKKGPLSGYLSNRW